jgi:tetratricopeptide (TPR) repeat protein
MKAQRFAEAIPLFRQAIEQDPAHWGNWYMAGQCCRFTNDLNSAVTYLKKAVVLKSDEPPVLLALGIAVQLTDHFIEANDAFRRAIETRLIIYTHFITNNYCSGVEIGSRSIIVSVRRSYYQKVGFSGRPI